MATTKQSGAVAPSWRGMQLAKRVWVCNSNSRFLFHVTAAQAEVLLSQCTVLAMKEPSDEKLWRVLIVSTPGPTAGPSTEPSVHTFKTPPSVLRVQNARTVAAPKTYEFVERDNRDRWAYLLSITENKKVVRV
jgi:hypothetical protein